MMMMTSIQADCQWLGGVAISGAKREFHRARTRGWLCAVKPGEPFTFTAVSSIYSVVAWALREAGKEKQDRRDEGGCISERDRSAQNVIYMPAVVVCVLRVLCSGRLRHCSALSSSRAARRKRMKWEKSFAQTPRVSAKIHRDLLLHSFFLPTSRPSTSNNLHRGLRAKNACSKIGFEKMSTSTKKTARVALLYDPLAANEDNYLDENAWLKSQFSWWKKIIFPQEWLDGIGIFKLHTIQDSSKRSFSFFSQKQLTQKFVKLDRHKSQFEIAIQWSSVTKLQYATNFVWCFAFFQFYGVKNQRKVRNDLLKWASTISGSTENSNFRNYWTSDRLFFSKRQALTTKFSREFKCPGQKRNGQDCQYLRDLET